MRNNLFLVLLRRIANTLTKTATFIDRFLAKENSHTNHYQADQPPIHWQKKVRKGAPFLLQESSPYFEPTEFFSTTDRQNAKSSLRPPKRIMSKHRVKQNFPLSGRNGQLDSGVKPNNKARNKPDTNKNKWFNQLKSILNDLLNPSRKNPTRFLSNKAPKPVNDRVHRSFSIHSPEPIYEKERETADRSDEFDSMSKTDPTKLATFSTKRHVPINDESVKENSNTQPLGNETLVDVGESAFLNKFLNANIKPLSARGSATFASTGNVKRKIEKFDKEPLNPKNDVTPKIPVFRLIPNLKAGPRVKVKPDGIINMLSRSLILRIRPRQLADQPEILMRSNKDFKKTNSSDLPKPSGAVNLTTEIRTHVIDSNQPRIKEVDGLHDHLSLTSKNCFIQKQDKWPSLLHQSQQLAISGKNDRWAELPKEEWLQLNQTDASTLSEQHERLAKSILHQLHSNKEQRGQVWSE